MNTTKQAVMYVNRKLLEELLPDFENVALLRYGDLVNNQLSVTEKLAEMAKPFHTALKLPASCWITAISPHCRFINDEVTFRIESPDFVETQEVCTLPEVRALYQTVHKEGKPDWSYFLRWEWPAVAVQRMYDSAGNEIRLSCALANAIEYCPSGEPVTQYTGVATFQVKEGSLPCWHCHNPTTRRLPIGGVAECQECAEKSLL